MLMTHFIGQTDLKPSSVKNGQNGAITPSLTPTMQARCYNAGKWAVGDGGGGMAWGMGGGGWRGGGLDFTPTMQARQHRGGGGV